MSDVTKEQINEHRKNLCLSVLTPENIALGNVTVQELDPKSSNFGILYKITIGPNIESPFTGPSDDGQSLIEVKVFILKLLFTSDDPDLSEILIDHHENAQVSSFKKDITDKAMALEEVNIQSNLYLKTLEKNGLPITLDIGCVFDIDYKIAGAFLQILQPNNMNAIEIADVIERYRLGLTAIFMECAGYNATDILTPLINMPNNFNIINGITLYFISAISEILIMLIENDKIIDIDKHAGNVLILQKPGVPRNVESVKVELIDFGCFYDCDTGGFSFSRKIVPPVFKAEIDLRLDAIDIIRQRIKQPGTNDYNYSLLTSEYIINLLMNFLIINQQIYKRIIGRSTSNVDWILQVLNPKINTYNRKDVDYEIAELITIFKFGKRIINPTISRMPIFDINNPAHNIPIDLQLQNHLKTCVVYIQKKIVQIMVPKPNPVFSKDSVTDAISRGMYYLGGESVITPEDLGLNASSSASSSSSSSSSSRNPGGGNNKAKTRKIMKRRIKKTRIRKTRIRKNKNKKKHK
jgi:hypothetical protein